MLRGDDLLETNANIMAEIECHLSGVPALLNMPVHQLGAEHVRRARDGSVRYVGADQRRMTRKIGFSSKKRASG